MRRHCAGPIFEDKLSNEPKPKKILLKMPKYKTQQWKNIAHK